MDEATRAWIYRLLVAVCVAAVLVALIVTGNVSDAIVPVLVAALIGNGLAVVNTSTTPGDPPP